MHFNFAPKDILGIIKRRFFWAAIPFLLTALGVILYIRSMDPIYESSTTLLVEDQQIRNEFVQSAVESDVLQRIEAISARVRARDNLLAIAAELNLYAEDGLNATERFQAMERDTDILIRRVVSNSRRNDDASAITVRIAYRSPSPTNAQRVTNALLTDFQSRSVDLRTEIAEETSDFLREEEIKIRRNLDQVGTAINEIKAENVNSLPENRTIYERALDRSTAEKVRLESGMRETEQALRMLQLQRPLLVRENREPTPLENELKLKRRALEALQREYQDTYPDVVTLKRDVLALEYDLEPAAFRQRATREIASLTSRMENETEGSPAYERLSTERSALRRQLRDVPDLPAQQNFSELQYRAQVETLNSRLESQTTQLMAINEKIVEYETQIAATPVVEGQLFRLEQERDQLQTDLSILRSQLAEAERSESLELQSKGERLTTIEQPTRPDQPIKPDKARLSIMGLAVAGLVAAIFGLLPEVLFAKVRSRDHLSSVLHDAQIVEVPDYTANRFTPLRIAAYAGMLLVTVALTGAVGYTALQTLI